MKNQVMIQRKHLEVLKKKQADKRGKQKDFRDQTNESIMMSVMSVIGGSGSSVAGGRGGTKSNYSFK